MSEDTPDVSVPTTDLDSIVAPPAAAIRVRAFWGEMINKLPPMDEDEVRSILSDPAFNITLPESVLTPEGYSSLHALIFNLRSRAIQVKDVVDQHYFMRMRAIKNLEKVLMKFSEGRTEKLKEADVELWLMPQKRSLENITMLKLLVDSRVSNLDFAAMQVSRQHKAVEVGHRVSLVDFSMIKELPEGYGENREPEHGRGRRNREPEVEIDSNSGWAVDE